VQEVEPGRPPGRRRRAAQQRQDAFAEHSLTHTTASNPRRPQPRSNRSATSRGRCSSSSTAPASFAHRRPARGDDERPRGDPQPAAREGPDRFDEGQAGPPGHRAVGRTAGI
jgi:hypothetical protein